MVSRADLAEAFFRQTLRPASSAARGAEGTARFSLEAAEPRPAAPARPASRRDDTASARSDAIRADRMDAAKTENAKIGAARTETAKSDGAKSDRTDVNKAESGPSGASQESRAQAASARSKPLAARTGRDGAEAASARNPGAAKTANSTAQRPEPAQEAAAEEVAAKEAGAAVVSEDEARERDETDPASPEAAAPTPLLAPPPAPAAAPTNAAGVSAGEGGLDANQPVTGLPGEATATGHAAKTGTGDAPVSAAASTAGFEAALTEAVAPTASPIPAPAGPATALTPPGGVGAAQGPQAAQAADAAAAASQPATPPIPLGAVPMTIGLRSLSGMNRFAIRLDPVELGRIDVSLDLDKAGGKARAHLVVDRPETLALLQRDAGSLQQALAQAGFDVGAEAGGGGIDLSLRGETGSQGGRDGESASRDRSDGGPGGPGGRDARPSPLDAIPLRQLRAVGNLDIRI
ncbi:flagellar hook-length control protein FliK [Methylorubrum extorquens]|uniref:Flagellar hook-length control protein n=1 Tax=Methylorubrum extorquens (strain CM4 / NCIMB 13688) TaxID=440085 RepID=B7KNC2_METC4|nr:flagellar hook-length control protein FliK [Methylorubrum extorquens]ACK85239.1 flagellar hook-length control protein [Methylorubrum extorquens CM4]